MAWTRENFIDGTPYAAVDFNRMILDGIDEAMTKGGGSNAYAQKQTVNMAKGMKKLRNNEPTEFCWRGDSIWYAFVGNNEAGDGIAEDCNVDIGSPLTGFKRSPVTIYDTFRDVMNVVYENNVTIKKQIYSGDTVYTSFFRWYQSKSDFNLILYGINDAVGSHITDGYTDGVSTTIPKPYKGNVEYFLEGYRKVIEKEIDGGTAVIIVTPTKQTLTNDGVDVDGRTLIDIYEQALVNLGREYNIPVVDGNELTKNFDNTMAIDFCHFTKDGFRAIGHRLASIFVGQSPLNPNYVYDGMYLGVNPYVDNCNIAVPTVFDNSEISPNLPVILNSGDLYVNIDRATGGLQANVNGAGSITWSFYCPYDGMVVVPCMWTNDVPNILVRLDFGAKQGKWNNYWNVFGVGEAIDRAYEEPSEIILNSSTDMTTMGAGCYHGITALNSTHKKAIRITSRGWHTLTISIKAKDKPARSDISTFSDIPEVTSLQS